MNFRDELELCALAAQKAGDCLKGLARASLKTLSTDGRDIKLQADRDAESIILSSLADSGHPILSEEEGEVGKISSTSPCWIVDPLDGTLNFSRGIPISCVSIALCLDDNPLLGVVYDFNRNELFKALVGTGAWCNDTKISVSNVADSRQGILTTGFSVARSFEDKAIFGFISQIKTFKKVRLIGSAALSLAYVAAGRVDAYAEDDIMLWDVAAGVALVSAAGGHVDMQSTSTSKWTQNVRCASTAAIWDVEAH